MNKKTGIFLSRSLLFLILLQLNYKPVLSQEEFYIPKALLIPVHTQSKQLFVSLGTGCGYDGNVSYSLSNHFAVFATGTLSTGTHERPGFLDDRHSIDKNDHAVKAGIGYFTKRNRRQLTYVESYAGYGSYKVDNYWYFPGDKGTSGYKTKAKFWNVFWQIQSTHRAKKHEITGAIRLAYSRYNYLEYRDVSLDYIQASTSLDGLWGITADPLFSYSYLVKKFKFNVQLGGSAGLNSPVNLDQTNYRTEGGQVIATKNPGTTRMKIGAPIGRLAVQYCYDFRKN